MHSIKQALLTPVLAIMAAIWAKIKDPIHMCMEGRNFQIKIVLGVETLPQTRIEMILERKEILLNKTGILIIIMGTVLLEIIIEIIIFLLLILEVVSKGTTMLPRAIWAQTRPMIIIDIMIGVKIIIVIDRVAMFVKNGVYHRRGNVSPPNTAAYESGRS